MKYKYSFNCVSSDSETINNIKDNSKQITYNTFLKHVSYKDIINLFPFYGHYKQGLTIKKDWHIAYYKSKYKGKTCYYMVHSAIEYIFIKAS